MFQEKHRISKVIDAAHKAGCEMAELNHVWMRKG